LINGFQPVLIQTESFKTLKTIQLGAFSVCKTFVD